MTENQIKYVSYLENKRHNEATELQTNREIAETIRNNMANNAVASLNANTNWRNANTNERAQETRNFEAVTNRYAAEQNVRIRDYQNYLNLVGLQENARHNLANETETHRSNLANENLRAVSNYETHRSNLANENLRTSSNYIDYLTYLSKDKDYSSRANLNAAKTESQNIMNAIDKSTIGAQIAYKTASATEQIGKAKQSKLAGAVASAQLGQASRLASINVETKYQQYINEIYKEYQADAQIANTKAQTKKAKSGVLKDIGDFFKSAYHIAVN